MRHFRTDEGIHDGGGEAFELAKLRRRRRRGGDKHLRKHTDRAKPGDVGGDGPGMSASHVPTVSIINKSWGETSSVPSHQCLSAKCSLDLHLSMAHNDMGKRS